MRKGIRHLFEGKFELKHKKDKGVYFIYFVGSKKYYIGSTCSKKGFEDRWRQHVHCLRNNKHANSIMQRIYNKYGESSMRFKILEVRNQSEKFILDREQFYIDYLKPTLNVNKLATGCAFPDGWKSSQAKPVLQYDLEGNFIKEYESINEAARALGKGDLHQTLSRVNEAPTQSGGYQWRLKEGDTFPLKIEKYKFPQEIEILCYDSTGRFYKEYPSILKASRELKIDTGNISRVVRGQMRSYNGYFFKEKTNNDYPLIIDDYLRLHKNQLSIDIEDLQTKEKYHFDSLRKIPKDLLSRCSLRPYLRKGIFEFTFRRNVTHKNFKIKIQNYNKV